MKTNILFLLLGILIGVAATAVFVKMNPRAITHATSSDSIEQGRETTSPAGMASTGTKAQDTDNNVSAHSSRLINNNVSGDSKDNETEDPSSEEETDEALYANADAFRRSLEVRFQQQFKKEFEKILDRNDERLGTVNALTNSILKRRMDLNDYTPSVGKARISGLSKKETDDIIAQLQIEYADGLRNLLSGDEVQAHQDIQLAKINNDKARTVKEEFRTVKLYADNLSEYQDSELERLAHEYFDGIKLDSIPLGTLVSFEDFPDNEQATLNFHRQVRALLTPEQLDQLKANEELKSQIFDYIKEAEQENR